MCNLENRVKRIEDEIGRKGEWMIRILTNVAPWNGEETPCYAKIAPDRWAIAIQGGPFTAEEIRTLRQAHNEERNRNALETEN